MILELCKGVHCVDLDESFQTHIYLQNLASIQPRTSPLKFAATCAEDAGNEPLARRYTPNAVEAATSVPPEAMAGLVLGCIEAKFCK